MGQQSCGSKAIHDMKPGETAVPDIGPLPPSELNEALAGTGLGALYQPVVRLQDREPVSLEVLARLDHPRHGVLAPEHFVPQMEDAGLARRLTEGVAARAFCDHARYLSRLGLSLALNFPLDVLLDDAALTALDVQRQAAGIAASKVLIELTERRALDTHDAREMAAFRSAMLRLRGQGYGLAIDDAGPETADLLALLEAGFTALKLDRGAVEASATEPEAGRFLRNTVAAARAAGIVVIAEGVEDQHTWRRMHLLGVDQAQGFLIAAPLPVTEVPAWAQAWRSALG